ncbi:hypothetical protein PPERSA_06102 [Pseudocohnilembus persalinus]|uniref:Uncharacterized protein n=1 Tax=Pseudocohnilembus persalinus TaxID=266149 RepID=A0A0V0QV34_PSEPJ|nr:hypothetical protein PPERSA_06102 [Pseudocohnilembus persalinus]|eukprot:KRX06220.1 hypothetical protein PPERSA_06102 [Pseudocohnilembus persalinus]
MLIYFHLQFLKIIKLKHQLTIFITILKYIKYINITQIYHYRLYKQKILLKEIQDLEEKLKIQDQRLIQLENNQKNQQQAYGVLMKITQKQQFRKQMYQLQ